MKEAIRATLKGFAHTDRGQLIMACGTGKTLTAMWISERLRACVGDVPGERRGESRTHRLAADHYGARATVLADDEGRTMVMLDLVNNAEQATWTDGYVSLPWATDVEGASVRHAEHVTLEDGKVAPRVIEVCPRRPQGTVIGRFAEVAIPADGAQVRTSLGFRQGGGGGGAYFSVIAEFAGAADGTPLRREYYKPEQNYVIDDCHFDLMRFAGMTGTIGLKVEAANPGANAVWTNTQLVSLADEYPFAEYVGAAVGSGMAGETLVNPWGGKSGVLFGDIWVVLEFRNIDMPYPLQLESVYEGVSHGTVDLGSVAPGQTTVSTPLTRTERGRWTERVIFNGTYNGDVRYTVNDVGE